MRNTSARKNSSGASKSPPGNGVHHSASKTPGGASGSGNTPGGGTKPMPRVGGHTTNNAPGQGVGGGPYGGKSGC